MDTAQPPLTLTALLDDLGVSQAELARRLSLRRSAVNNWCAQGTVPAEHVAPICDALALSPERAAAFARAVGAPLPRAVETVVHAAGGL